MTVSDTSRCLKVSNGKKTTKDSVQRVNNSVTECAPWPMVPRAPLHVGLQEVKIVTLSLFSDRTIHNVQIVGRQTDSVCRFVTDTSAEVRWGINKFDLSHHGLS